MRLVTIALCTVLSSLTLSACEAEKVEAPRPAAPVVVRVEQPKAAAPAPAPAPAPVQPKRESVHIGPGGVAIETSNPDSTGSVKIDFPKR